MSDSIVEEKEQIAEQDTVVDQSQPVTSPPEESKKQEVLYDQDRIHISNLPKIIGFKQFKKVLDKNLDGIHPRKVRQMKQFAYVSFDSPEDTQKAIKLLNGVEIKKCALSVKLAVAEERKIRPQTELAQAHAEKEENFVAKTARESVTPLADVPYQEQLEMKNKESLRLVERLIGQMRKANVEAVAKLRASDILKTIKPAPKIKEYRNKCEFTIGLTLEGKVCVGFVGGRYAKNQHYVIPADDVGNVTTQTKAIVKDFTEYIKETGLPPMDEFARCGVWKMLTVREFGGDVMIIVTVFPIEDKELEKKVQTEICSRFLDNSTLSLKGYRVTSVYWTVMANCSDPINYEHIGGTPYIYETVLDCRFRVSPSAFFQTNSQAAAVLYKTIGEACGFTPASAALPDPAEGDGEAVASKKARLDSEHPDTTENEAPSQVVSDPGTILLDICCGTGTIGVCLMKEYSKGNKMFCVGIEMVSSAVEDAKQNCKDNGMSDKSCKYIAGKAEDVFRSLRYYLPSNFSLTSSNVVGVLDPPRAGLHEKVVLGCRQMETLRRIVFVSCDPSAAMKNLVDFCRPTSKKYDGEAFTLESVQPVDMFPLTGHFEWVVTLRR